MKRKRGKALLPFIGGLALGVALTLAGTIVGMRSLMVLRYDSPRGFDETVRAVEQAARAQGWATPGTMNLNKSMAKHGVSFKPKVRLVRLCKAKYASKVLGESRHMATMMPCRIAVYETDDGRVRVAKLNTGLLGKLFGGVVAEIMGGKVAADEEKILRSVLGPGESGSAPSPVARATR
jgi:uncharacterized protein (DUF302 family)